jgi:hypothetical protein
VALFLFLPAVAVGGDNSKETLPQQAYVWQRTWNGPVQAAIGAQATNFARLILLHAEMQWVQGGANPSPRVVRVPIDFEALPRRGPPVGLALRVGPYPGPFAQHDAMARRLTDLAESLVTEARTNGVVPLELQIDFDCAESKLEGYRQWVTALRRRVGPLPVVITVLPAWLRQKAFRELAGACDGYVLQVHSLARPQRVETPFTLCDPVKARAAVSQASRLGFPFRIALPTYGYWVGFDSNGDFIGLSAEGSSRRWPAGTQLREVNANPRELAGLVGEWLRKPPPFCQGLIWYRLPVAQENLNWPFATLSMVMSGRSPTVRLRLEAHRSEAGSHRPGAASGGTLATLVEVEWVNSGTATKVGPAQVNVRWRNSRLVAGDGLYGFALSETGLTSARLSNHLARLLPDERQRIGWLRFNQETEVELEMDLEQEQEPKPQQRPEQGPTRQPAAEPRPAKR